PIVLPSSVSLSLPRHRATHHLPAFPTRRSSDLSDSQCDNQSSKSRDSWFTVSDTSRFPVKSGVWRMSLARFSSGSRMIPKSRWRSEEHTSELQSRFDLVCRLLLE